MAAHSGSSGVMVDEALLMQGFFSFFFRVSSAYHTPPYPTPCDNPDRKNARCNFDHTIAWLDNKKAYFWSYNNVETLALHHDRPTWQDCLILRGQSRALAERDAVKPELLRYDTAYRNQLLPYGTCYMIATRPSSPRLLRRRKSGFKARSV